MQQGCKKIRNKTPTDLDKKCTQYFSDGPACYESFTDVELKERSQDEVKDKALYRKPV